MGPPHPSWKKEVQTFRNTHIHSTEQLCQLGSHWKAPKWTFGNRYSDAGVDKGSLKGPQGIGDKAPERHPRQPVYSFGAAPDGLIRNRSAPPGPNWKPRGDPTTPQWSFGTTSRPNPFGPKESPGPLDTRGGPGGPKYSFPPGPQRPAGYGAPYEVTPSPDHYGLLPGRRPPGPRWGPGTVLDGRPKKPDHGPGPNYAPGPWRDGPAYSFRPQLPAGGDGDAGASLSGFTLPPPYTFFGYNEFGHNDTFDIKNIKAHLGRKDAVGPDGKPMTKADIAALRKSVSMPAGKFHVIKTAIDDHPVRKAMTEQLKQEATRSAKAATK